MILLFSLKHLYKGGNKQKLCKFCLKDNLYCSFASINTAVSTYTP